MEIIFLIGRVLFGGFFIMSGVNHFMKMDYLSGWVTSKGLPMASFLVILSGVMMILGGLGIILGIYAAWSAWLLIIFLVPTNLKLHNFWTISDAQEKMMQKMNFMKNVAFIGASLMIVYLAGVPWPYAF